MPIDRGIVDHQLQALGEGSRWWNTRELRDLPEVLHADEHILAISRGKIARVRWLRRAWLIVVTERRLVCLRSGARTGWRQLEVSTSHMERVSIRVGLFRGRVLIQTGDHTYRLLVPRPDAYKLEAALSSLITPAQGSRQRGPARMVYRMMDHVLSLPAVALGEEPRKAPPPEKPQAPQRSKKEEDRLEALEAEVHALRQQVDFLEELLRKRHELPPAGQRRIGARPPDRTVAGAGSSEDAGTGSSDDAPSTGSPRSAGEEPVESAEGRRGVQ